MKIATLQFDPSFGEVELSIRSADSLLFEAEQEGNLRGVELLVLPELAFAGYNHPSREAIEPYLEPTAHGPSTQWAIKTATRLKCTVAVGYPEKCMRQTPAGGTYDHPIRKEVGQSIEDSANVDNDKRPAYNSLVFVDANGTVVAHYRKHHLYYTDEPWAEEGPDRFLSCNIPLGSASADQQEVKAVIGICMDLNPRRFEAPWTAFEFSRHAEQCEAKLVVVSMAWLTRLTKLELDLNSDKPDLDTFSYWLERFRPLFTTDPTGDLPGESAYASHADIDAEVVVVLANRIGGEGMGRIIGDVRYAGSSCVIGLKKTGEVRLWNILGRAAQGVCVADTKDDPTFAVKMSPSASDRG